LNDFETIQAVVRRLNHRHVGLKDDVLTQQPDRRCCEHVDRRETGSGAARTSRLIGRLQLP